ncbi:MAG: histone deacetylase [Acidobacteria bacterium]|jgi:acetoin utilization deacetylase AcuC-like enzyme|nr:MAG: histone deacetylase [Acidobacteriota bacterium]
MKVGLVYDDIYLEHNLKGHPENKDRLIAIVQELDRRGIMKELLHISPRRATAMEVSLNHDPSYIQEIADFCLAGGGYLDPDTYVVSSSYEVALTAVGGVLEGIDRIISGEVQAIFCAVRPPGHHAEYAKAMGFCIFNNVAIGAHYLLQKGFERVFIVDFDAHHGNGTQKSFYEDSRVFYFSSHEYPFYPGTGSREERGAGDGYGFTHNEPLPAGAGDEEFDRVYGKVFPELFENYKPQFLLVSAGYDAHRDDPLTYLNLSTEGLGRLVENLLKSAKNLKVPVLFVLEGGYNLRVLGECVSLTIKKMLEA